MNPEYLMKILSSNNIKYIFLNLENFKIFVIYRNKFLKNEQISWRDIDNI